MDEPVAGVPVTFLPAGREATCGRHETLLEAARRCGVTIAAACGGFGRCDACAVRVEGHVPPALPEDGELFDAAELAAGWRRACTARPAGACVVHVPPRSAAASVARGQEGARSLVPIAEPVVLADGEGWRRRDGSRFAGRPLGLAVDVGTTNLAALFVDLPTGEILGTAAKGNPQGAWGADVISRLERALLGEATRREMSRVVLAAVAELGSELSEGSPGEIQEVALVGNAVMQHLLLGLALEGLARAPYRPAVLEAVERPAAELGLPFAPGARARFGPNVGGFVGSDHVAALLEVLADPPSEPWALVDVGTNTEITLASRGRRTAISCASGPAFEGGRLSCGVPAGAGAVDRVHVNGSGFALGTIGGARPIGLCGSGVVSLLAVLRGAGAVDARGAFDRRHPLVREGEGGREVLLAERTCEHERPLVFTQDDVRTIQLTKAAIRAGLDLLLAAHGLEEEDVGALLVAGAFGRYLDLDAARAIGLFPALPAERFQRIGNAAADGAARLLACAAARRRAATLARETVHLELAGSRTFQETFLRRTSL